MLEFRIRHKYVPYFAQTLNTLLYYRRVKFKNSSLKRLILGLNYK